jgi:hypothetical protein
MTRLWAAVLIVGLLGCGSHFGGTGSDAGDAPADQTPGDVDSAGGCTGSPGPNCVVFACCNDIIDWAVCVNGEWTCPEGTIDTRSCPGPVRPPPPGCDCTEAGVVCPACCPITEDPIPGGCMALGGARALQGDTCTTICDSHAPYVRTTDENGCPKLVPGSCGDASVADGSVADASCD